MLFDMTTAGLNWRTALGAQRKRKAPLPSPLTLYWLGFSVSSAAYILHVLLGNNLPMISTTLAVIGLAPCGMAWLYSRALFRAGAENETWPHALVAALYGLGLLFMVFPGASSHGLMGYLASVYHLLSSAMLLLTLFEPLDGLSKSQKDRRFRIIFAVGYTAILGTGFVVALPEMEMVREPARAVLASTALIGTTIALHFRSAHPLERRARKPERMQPIGEHADLAIRLNEALHRKQVYLDPELKVADLAQLLGTAEYKLSQCITGELGFNNFNQLVNSYRISEAKRRFSDAQFDTLPILTIAMDCGFASIGPFNRAFKADMGVTPSAFRSRSKVLRTKA